jgi:D-glycero-D-manno-heptose 1,7-bisphosphate phosphatase
VRRRPAIFLDRDGTLNQSVGFINHASLFRLYPWTTEAVRLINQSGFAAVLVTNQSGVARGLYTEELVEEVHTRLAEHLAESGAHLDGVYYCPHGVSGIECDCRKPKGGMLLRAERELGVDLSRSYVVGDSRSDLETAWNVGARAALVFTGYGRGIYETLRGGSRRLPDIVAPNVHSAVMEIVWEAEK